MPNPARLLVCRRSMPPKQKVSSSNLLGRTIQTFLPQAVVPLTYGAPSRDGLASHSPAVVLLILLNY